MRLPTDLREFIESLNSNHVEFVVVGGYALAFHGFPRFTGDLDILVRPSAENAARLEQALVSCGFGSLGLKATGFPQPGQVIQLGHPPNRIDILTSITGISFDEIWSRRIAAELDSVPVHFIDRDSFLRNKRATGRAKDKADLESLGID